MLAGPGRSVSLRVFVCIFMPLVFSGRMENRQNSAPCYRRFLILLVVLNLCFVFILLFSTFFAGYQWDSTNLAIQSFFNKADRFADLYNPAQYAMDRNLMNDTWTNSPPFLHFCGYAASAAIGLFLPGQLQNYFGGGNVFGQSPAGYFFWLTIVAVTVLVICRQCRRLLNSKAGYFYGFFAVALCYPFLYAVDRGNYVMFVVMLLALFMADYADHPYRAAVWLGIAAALKLYPAILCVLFLRRKRLWKPALVCVGTGIGLTLLSLLFFSDGQHAFMLTFTDWLAKMKQYTILGNGSLLNPVLCFSIIVFLLVLRRDEWLSPIKKLIPIPAKSNA